MEDVAIVAIGRISQPNSGNHRTFRQGEIVENLFNLVGLIFVDFVEFDFGPISLGVDGNFLGLDPNFFRIDIENPGFGLVYIKR